MLWPRVYLSFPCSSRSWWESSCCLSWLSSSGSRYADHGVQWWTKIASTRKRHDNEEFFQQFFDKQRWRRDPADLSLDLWGNRGTGNFLLLMYTGVRLVHRRLFRGIFQVFVALTKIITPERRSFYYSNLSRNWVFNSSNAANALILSSVEILRAVNSSSSRTTCRPSG